MKFNVKASNVQFNVTDTQGNDIISYAVSEYAFAIDINALIKDAATLSELVKTVVVAINAAAASVEEDNVSPITRAAY